MPLNYNSYVIYVVVYDNDYTSYKDNPVSVVPTFFKARVTFDMFVQR